MKVKVSVIMAVYNGSSTIKRAIDSILAQSFNDFEFVIVNDGSTDSTSSILEEYSRKDSRIVVVDQENMGLTKSLNVAIEKASGEFIARQDADDESMHDRLEKQYEYMQKHEDVVVLGTNYMQVSGDNQKKGRFYSKKALNRVVYLFNPLPHSSVMIRKSVFLENGMYDESFYTSQDAEAWMRLAEVGSVDMLEDTLVKIYNRKDSISSTKRLLQRKNGLRARLKHPRYGRIVALMAWLFQTMIVYMPSWVFKLKSSIIKG